MSKYTTGEIAKLCNVSVRTVQYYDARGILEPSELSEGGRRLYSETDLKKMRIICFLRDTGLSINSIGELLCQENSREVVELLFQEQERFLKDEIAESQSKLKKLNELQQILKKSDEFTVESIGDVAHIMEHKNQMRKLHATMLISGIPLGIVQWSSIILWITTGIWWPFLVYAAIVVPYGIWISVYYFKRVSYICPQCHEIFTPRFKEAFWANHTPKTRKLTCPCCGHKGFCVETYRKEEPTV